MSFLAAVTHLDEGEILTSESLEKLLAPTYDALKLSQGRIEMQSGIGSRRMWPVGTLPSHLSTRAAQQLFQKESIDPSIEVLPSRSLVSLPYTVP
jgi:3-oxoacyl-[acyl-carrier-protein] synthase-3